MHVHKMLMFCCVLAAEYGMKKIIVTYETQEHAQRAATILGDGNDQMPRVSVLWEGIVTFCEPYV